MATDVVFFLKAMAKGQSLPWPGPVKLIAVDPESMGIACGGADRLCSTAYGNLWSALKGSDGRVLPNFLRRFAKGVDVGRVAFVGFSAAHGFLNPLANNDADRADISAFLLLDATFDGLGAQGGKKGYVEFAADAARGERLLVTSTANTAGWDAANKRPAHLTGNESWELVWRDTMAVTGMGEEIVEPRGSMPAPVGGVHQMGELLFWYEYVDKIGKSQITHTAMGQVLEPMLASYLIPYWSGELGGGRLPSWFPYVASALGVAGVGLGAYYLLGKRFGWR